MKIESELPSTSWMKIYWEMLMSSMDIPRRGRAPGASAGPHPQAQEHLQGPSREVRALQQAALGLGGASSQSWLEAASVNPFSYCRKKKKFAFLTGVRCAPRHSSEAQPLLGFSKAPILE